MRHASVVFERVAVVPNHERLSLDELRGTAVARYQPQLALAVGVEENLLCLVDLTRQIPEQVASVQAQWRLVEKVPAQYKNTHLPTYSVDTNTNQVFLVHALVHTSLELVVGLFAFHPGCVHAIGCLESHEKGVHVLQFKAA